MKVKGQKNIKVSIIVPIYNVEKEIARCILSIIKQNYREVELILVNDSSPDNSFDIARKLVEDHDFQSKTIFISHSNNCGVSAARDSGITVATGDYLFFIDSDDELTDANAITLLVAIASKYQYPDVIFGGHQRLTEIEVLEIPYIKKGIYYNNLQLYGNYSKLIELLNDYAWGKLINRKFLIDNNLFFKKNIYFEDTLWGFNFYRKVNTIVVAPYIVYNYYVRDGSITSTVANKHVTDFNRVIELMYREFKLNPDYYPLITQREIERRRKENVNRMLELSHFDKTYICKEVDNLKKIKISPFTGKFSYFKFNLFLRMPTLLIYKQLLRKWKKLQQ